MSDPRASGSHGPRDEARLHLEWVRDAAGPLLWTDPLPPAAPHPEPPRGVGADEGPGPVEAAARLERIAEMARACRRCALCETRTNAVPGEGSSAPKLMVVGEAPGADEDESGRPFVGRAGQLLTRMLAAIGLSREDVFIGNVLKCRPPGNRPPHPLEVAACKPFLLEQIAVLRPRLILALGNPAVHALIDTDLGITRLRGRFTTTREGWRVLPTYHPAYLLRNPASKAEAWSDLQAAAKDLGLTIPRGDAEGPRGDPEGPRADPPA